MVKIISMYLPQFHIIPENDAWWGEGYTEWTAVKNAKPLYDGHEQPRYPYESFYYDLLDKSTFEWQADLMKKSGIYGQCFYHYYFKNGRKILEKPAENLLKWTDIDIPFCFSWANESWVRSWDNINGGNTWTSIYEPKEIANDDSSLLLEQDYGNEQDWIDHFYYLLPFFKDDRYICKDGKPIFLFYKPDDISCLKNMILCWNKLAEKEGLQGIYYIGKNSREEILDARLIQEPQYTISCNYDELYNNPYGIKRIIEGESFSIDLFRNALNNSDAFYCGTPGFDNSPRNGKTSTIIEKLTPQIFYKQVQSLLSKSKSEGKDYLFINAWNEWGESMYLEPDEKNGLAYLEAVGKAIDNIDAAPEIQIRDITVNEQANVINRYKSYWKLFDKWLYYLEKGVKIETYFTKNNYRRIVIYGMGMVGKHLLRQLEGTSVEVVCGMDIRAESISAAVPVLKIGMSLEEIDVIVSCVTYGGEKIAQQLNQVYDNIPIITVEEILDSCFVIKKQE